MGDTTLMEAVADYADGRECTPADKETFLQWLCNERARLVQENTKLLRDISALSMERRLHNGRQVE